MRLKTTTLALTFAAIAALCAGSGEALAKSGKGRRGRRHETQKLERTAEATSRKGRGTVEITDTRRGRHVAIKLRHLEPRTVYDIVDSGTGQVLGVVRTNRKGRANFELGAGARNKPFREYAETEEPQDVPMDGGMDEPSDEETYEEPTDEGMDVPTDEWTEEPTDEGTDDGWQEPADETGEEPETPQCPEPEDVVVDEIDGIEIVCEPTSEPVLECDFDWVVPVENCRFAQGSAFFGSALNGAAYVTLTHFVEGTVADENFSFTYVPVYAPDDPEANAPQALVLTTAGGDSLPLGASNVLELGGLDFQVKTKDGSEVLLSGKLPTVECVVEEPVEDEWDFSGDAWDFGSDDWDFGDDDSFGDDWSGDDSFGDDWGGGGWEEDDPFGEDWTAGGWDGGWTPDSGGGNWNGPSRYVLCLRNPATGEFEEVGDLRGFGAGGGSSHDGSGGMDQPGDEWNEEPTGDGQPTDDWNDDDTGEWTEEPQDQPAECPTQE